MRNCFHRLVAFGVWSGVLAGGSVLAEEAGPVSDHAGEIPYVISEPAATELPREAPMAASLPNSVAVPESLSVAASPSPQPGAFEVLNAASCGSTPCAGTPGYRLPLAPKMIGGLSLLSPRLSDLGLYLVQHRHFTRIADNNSPLPQTRASLTYNLISDAITREEGMGAFPDEQEDIHEYRINLEKAFYYETVSVGMVIPWALTTDSTLGVDSLFGSEMNAEFGNLAFTSKVVLHETSCRAVSAGLLMEVPTADDLRDFGLYEEESSWYFTPYLAAVSRPTDRTFLQSFFSYRMPTSPSEVYLDGVNGPVDSFRQPNVLMFDASIGYWAYRSKSDGFVRAFAPTLEFHYASTTEAAEPPTFNNQVVLGHTDNLSVTVGATTFFSNQMSLATAFAFPTRESDLQRSDWTGPTDRLYDWQFLVQLNVFAR